MCNVLKYRKIFQNGSVLLRFGCGYFFSTYLSYVLYAYCNTRVPQVVWTVIMATTVTRHVELVQVVFATSLVADVRMDVLMDFKDNSAKVSRMKTCNGREIHPK